jgi:anti-sigma B factor antagonist
VKPIEVSWHDTDIAIVTLNGEHDLATKEALDHELQTLLRAGECVVVDLSQAEFIDSSVLHTLLETDRMARERGRTFTLQLGTAAIVRRALEISGVLDALSCAPSRADAIRQARQPASHNGGPPG